MPVEIVLDEPAIREFIAGPCSASIMEIVGPAVTEGARRRAPVLTGKLLESIGWSKRFDSTAQYAQIHAVFYDLFLEKPARQMRVPQRTLIDAMNQDTPKVM